MTCDSNNINSCSRKVKLYFNTVAKCKITILQKSWNKMREKKYTYTTPSEQL